MKLRKLNEYFVRSYKEQGDTTTRVNAVDYSVIDNEEKTIGNASCYGGSANLTLNITTNSVEEGVQKLAEMLNATIEEGGEA